MLIFEKIFNKDLNRSAFLVGCGQTGQVALIDAGFGYDLFRPLVARENWTITHVLDTHLSQTYLQGGYLIAARTGATYVSGFIDSKAPVTCHFHKASSERPFYIGEVKVSMTTEGSDVVYTFSHEGDLSRSVSKDGEIEINSRLRQETHEVVSEASLYQDESLPFYKYAKQLKKLNAAFSLPTMSSPRALTPKLFREYVERGRQIVDLRAKASFEKKFIPGSIFIGQSYAVTWAPYLLDCDKKIILVGEEFLSMQKCIDSIHKLGVFDVEGYLEGTLESWDHLNYPVASIATLDMEAFFKAGFDLVVDVRTEAEVAHQPIDGALNIPLRRLHRQKKVFKDKRCGFFCSGGARSLMAASLALNFGAKSCAHLGSGILAYPMVSLPS